jgi:hypothetical protein
VNNCLKSQYKDDRHHWHGPSQDQPVLKLRYCTACGRVEVQQLTDTTCPGGDIWTTIAVGQKVNS